MDVWNLERVQQVLEFAETRGMKPRSREHTHPRQRSSKEQVRFPNQSPSIMEHAKGASMQLARTRYAGAKAFLYFPSRISPFGSGRVKREAHEMTTTLRWRRGQPLALDTSTQTRASIGRVVSSTAMGPVQHQFNPYAVSALASSSSLPR